LGGKSVLLEYMTALRKTWIRGFTLIEILVMAAVIGIMVGGGMATYARYDKRQKVEQAALGYANQLRVIQKKADAGQRTNCLVGELTGYAVSAPATATQATETEKCSTYDGSTAIFPLRHKAKFSDTDGGMVAVFRTLSRGVQFPDLPTMDGVVLVADADDSIKYEVEVTSGGYITVTKL
jgi:type II secretory pathway pseudopilin PulG